MTFYRPLRPTTFRNIHYGVLQIRANVIWNVKTWLIDHGLGRLTW